MIQLHHDEQIISEVRRHWLPLVGQAIALILLGVFPFALEILLANMSVRASDAISHYQSHITLLESAWMLVLWLAFAVAWTNHYLDVLIITNQRILDIDQLGLFSRDVAELYIANIEDIRIEVPGFLAHWLNFGNIELQTAAESKAFSIRNIVNPEKTKNIISRVSSEVHRSAQKR